MLGPLRAGSPRRIGPYEVLATLGAGGMGEVYLARGEAGGGTGGGTAGSADGPGSSGGADVAYVAVKTVRRDVAGEPAFRERFRREIKVAGLVRSAYAAAPVGGDADADPPWLATAYVPGPSLAQAVRRGGPLPVATVRALGARIARALADLHAAGVLHRDLKPGNVMLAVDGPRLIDFGIARASGATTMTATGLMVGTPSFMSPEHVAGARHVTGASDVFCLGSLLCHAATGEDPFGDGPVAAVLYRVSQAEADLTRVPEELRGVVAACLARDPADRPAPEALVELLGGTDGRVPAWPEAVREHIGAYGQELAQLVAAGGPLLELPPAPAPAAAPGLHAAPTQAPTAAPVTAPVTAPPPKRRRRGLIAAVTALAVLGAGVGAYLLWPDQPQTPRRPTAAPPAPSGPRIPGVDDRGLADASGVVPQNAAQRPAGWKPWQAKLTAPAFGCSGNEKALVCRTTDGRYEALDPANGKTLWEAGLNGDKPGGKSYMTDHGLPWITDKAGRPTVHDSVVVLTGEDRLQVRDLRTGAVRWENHDRIRGTQGVASRPIVADGMLFAATRSPGDESSRRTGMTAYDLADGHTLWTTELTNTEIAYVDMRGFEPVAYAKGTVYALSAGGLAAYDARTGALRGQVDRDARGCETLKVLGAAAYCVTVPRKIGVRPELRLLDAATLASKGGLPVPVGKLAPDVITPKAAVSFEVKWTTDQSGIRTGGSDGTLKVDDPEDGRELASYSSKATPSGLAQRWSAPLLAGDQVVYADYSALYTVRLGPDGKPGGVKATPVPGAPGPRAEEDSRDMSIGGIVYERMMREPEVLPVGGIAYLVYDKGVVASVELPN
ncbi:PQQ-binding-like beta-propeller repeat protein [Streptomyces sp. NPDC048623]|uniref:protein kinase domain-containing protein n=1 Tax=Streptomyces sp. NPDC048623 TaxID=3155761 RepID=UPI00343188A9